MLTKQRTHSREFFFSLIKEPCVAKSGAGKQIDPSLKTGFDWLIKYIGMHFEELMSRIEEDVKRQRHNEMLLRREKSDRVRANRRDDR